MNILVFSDIHGSLNTVRLMQDIIQEKLPEHIILLGDILYHGPNNCIPEEYNPKECAAALAPIANKILAIQGNCDSEVDQKVLPFPMAAPFSWILADGLRIFATHGHLFSPDNTPPLAVGDILLYGHTHIPAATIQKGVYHCNPGSLTLPKEGHPTSYGQFTDGNYSVITSTGETYLRLKIQ